MLGVKIISQTYLRSTQIFAASSIHNQAYRFFASLPDHMDISMPALSPTMSNGMIAQWLVKEGDNVKPGDVLASIQTDKSTLDFVTQDEGYIAKILKPSGDDMIDVGVPIAVMVDNKDDVEVYRKESENEQKKEGTDSSKDSLSTSPELTKKMDNNTQSTSNASTSTTTTENVSVNTSSNADNRVFISPLARSQAETNNINIQQVAGTGPNGRIISQDINDFIQNQGNAVNSPSKNTIPISIPVYTQSTNNVSETPLQGSFEDISLSPMRKIIAKRLTESKVSIPHYYLSTDCRMDNLLNLRKELNNTISDKGKLSINDFILKASALTLRDVPDVNASWMNDFIRKYKYIDISVAVAVNEGLITPIVSNCDHKGLLTISNEVRSLSKQAKENTLKPEQYSGGTFTVSNLGMYGIKNFTAIINPPQSCILAVGGLESRLIPINDDVTKLVLGKYMNFTLSCDHRIIDGALGATWMKTFKQYIENPETMLL